MIFGFEERLNELKDVTNKAIFLLIETNSLELKDDLSLTFTGITLDQTATNTNQLRAAKNLGKILKQYDVASCFRALGVRKL